VNINDISKEFEKYSHDPMIHFYETFLGEYDPALRKSRGVWYTPQPVVKFMVKAVDDILKQDFEIPEGLADREKIILTQKEALENGKEKEVERVYHRVQVLDPATGTGTFLAEVVQKIYQNFENQQGMWQSYVSEHLIPRINGFEILMASYAMAHLKLDMLLHNTKYKHNNKERLRIFLTNSLDEAKGKDKSPFVEWLKNEANQASSLKKNVPVMVVLGNPPYSAISQNNGYWITKLIQDYKLIEKERIKEKKHWLNDDYVKFIRFGQ
jgi:predicted helicase